MAHNIDDLNSVAPFCQEVQPHIDAINLLLDKYKVLENSTWEPRLIGGKITGIMGFRIPYASGAEGEAK